MTSDELKHIISQGEGEKVEFKLSYNNETIETLNAFANTKGGYVLIGISNKNSIVGVDINEESIQNWLNEIKQKTSPSIMPDCEDITISGKTVVVFRIQEYPIKPIALKGRYFKRIKNSNHLLSLNEISDLHLQSLKVSWDSYENTFSTIDDLDLLKVSSFINKVNKGGRFKLTSDPIIALEKLRLVEDNKPTNASVLLFSKNEIEHTIHVGRFKTPEMIMDDKIYKVTLFEAVELVMQYLYNWIKVAFEITGKKTQRDEIFEYPIPALREIVLNSIVHRDYTSPIDIQIKIFDNSITVYNPGKLFGDLTIEELKTDYYQSNARNRLISEVFYLTHDIEKYGSGFTRIRKEISSYPTMEFNYKEMGNGFFVELKYKEQKTSNITPIKTPIKNVEITELEEKIIHKIIENPKISINKIGEKLGIGRDTVAEYINKLKRKGILLREGSKRGGSWKVIDKLI
ncbi:MAG: putative DNA binding domain-containing protein [Salinivirgaceae bacterium]|nr:putative DNA binding domain-containing protein [Salinivirgaceae bacterium]